MGDVLRYTASKDTVPATVDGFDNFYFVTDSPGQKRALLEAGINAMAKVKADQGMRRPAAMIRSSPWKAGSEQIPWHDVFDIDNGHVRYFGDHKPEMAKPVGTTTGNAALLEAFGCHQAPTAEERAGAAPLLLFRSVRVARSQVVNVRDQRPTPGSSVEADLQAVCKRFDKDKHAFEVLAAVAAAKVMRASGHKYNEGWLTRRSGDGGADSVGRLDIGSGLAGTKLVVLGQAKCIRPDGLVSAEQIARVVARSRCRRFETVRVHHCEGRFGRHHLLDRPSAVSGSWRCAGPGALRRSGVGVAGWRWWAGVVGRGDVDQGVRCGAVRCGRGDPVLRRGRGGGVGAGGGGG
ncbi:hypothetical protein [Kitasatospora sp. NPDC054795]